MHGRTGRAKKVTYGPENGPSVHSRKKDRLSELSPLPGPIGARRIDGRKEKLMRVQIPAYTDCWMVDDRYGEVVKSGWKFNHVAERFFHWVKLDKSGQTVRVIADDCTEVC